jgi:hypothetical protein
MVKANAISHTPCLMVLRQDRDQIFAEKGSQIVVRWASGLQLLALQPVELRITLFLKLYVILLEVRPILAVIALLRKARLLWI